MTFLKIALRLLGKSRAYTAVAILTLGLAIGATTAIFSVVHGVLLAPLPYADADRLVAIWETHPSFERMAVSWLDYRDWEKRQQAFSSIGGYRGGSMNLTGGERAERLRGLRFSASMMPTLGLAPVHGRNFTVAEDSPEGEPVVMISQRFWDRRFGRSEDALGKTLNLDGKPHTIIGILPAPFLFNPEVDVVAPLAQIGKERIEMRGNHWIPAAVGRLKPGVTLAQARADMESVSRSIGADNPDSNQDTRAAMHSLRDELVNNVRPTLIVLMGAVLFVLLVAIANVASLSLARGAARRKEMAVRAALGAGKGRLIGLVLFESVVVGLAGGALGVLLALWGVDILNGVKPDAIPTESVIAVDLRVLAFSVAISIAAGVLFGLLPALQAARATDLASALKEGDQRSGTGGARTRARNLLIVAEVAMALVLLVGAGLSVKAFITLNQLDPGFRSEGVAYANLQLPPSYGAEPAKLRAFAERLVEKTRAIPGVAYATLSDGLPIAGASETGFMDATKPTQVAGQHPMAVYYHVDAHYQKMLGLRLLAGRFIEDTDDRNHPPVIVIDERTAKNVFPGQDPIGRLILVGGGGPKHVVGVVAHVMHYGLGEPEPAPNQIYLSWRQLGDQQLYFAMKFVGVAVRAQPGVAPTSLLPQVSQAIAELDATLPAFGAQSMDKLVGDSLAGRRFAMMLLGVFAAVALILSVVGLYSVLSYLVTQRRHEIGVRMALGARPGNVERLVVLQGLKLVGVGLAIGVGVALALRKVLASILAGVEPTDPTTFIAVSGVLAAAAFLASWLPARRAARVDPMIALRSE